MRIRLSIALDIGAARPAEPEHDTQLDAYVESAAPAHEAPRVGFGTFTREEDT